MLPAVVAALVAWFAAMSAGVRLLPDADHRGWSQLAVYTVAGLIALVCFTVVCRIGTPGRVPSTQE